jgi:hypothetical protein
MDNADVVYWYSAHLVHLARQGPTQQLVVGPRVFVVDN